MWVTDDYEIITPGCGCPAFAVATTIYRKWGRNHTRWYCPHCSECRYFSGKSEEQKLKDRLAQEKDRTNRAEAQALKTSNSLGKLRYRIKNGVCPCCQRSFQNLRRHIATKHPQFGTSGTLKLFRESLAMTQVELSEEVGIRSLYVSLYERDKPVPQYAKALLELWVDGS